MQSTSTQTEAIPARKTSFRWLVMLLIFLIYTMAAADRANIGIILPFIRKEFEISNTEAGVLVSLFFLCYSLGQIPAGFLLSKLGVRKILPFFMIVTSAFAALIGTTSSIMALKIYRAGLGIAEAPLPLSMLATSNRWFPKKEKGTATGLFLAAAKMGPVIVPPIGAVIIALYGWRMVFLVCAVPGIVLSLIWLFSVADDPEKSKFTSDAEVEHIKAGQADVATELSQAGPADPAARSGTHRFHQGDLSLMGYLGLLLNIGYSSFSVYSMGRVSKETYPLAAFLVNAGGQAGGAIAPLATGIILDIYGWTQVFIFMSVCSFIAALVILTIVEPVSKKKA